MGEFNGETLKVRWTTSGNSTVVAPSGDVDLTASPVLRQAIRQVMAEKPKRLVIDLSAVGYMDSSGVATLVEAMQQSRRTGTPLLLAAMQDRVRSIFEIAKLHTVFTITPTVDQAVAG